MVYMFGWLDTVGVRAVRRVRSVATVCSEARWARQIWRALVAVMLFCSLPGPVPVKTARAASSLRVSQVYGGGGNIGAAWRNDFVEIFNTGADVVSLDGWSVEYAAAAGSNWRMTALTGLMISPGGYLLVQQASGSSGEGAALPAPDALGGTNLSASSGKVRLLDSMGQVVDLVGYGDADTYEGMAAAPGLSASQAALRRDGGCADTDENGVDFEAAQPQPRNSASPFTSCAVPESSPTPPSTLPPASPPAATPPATPSPEPQFNLFISEVMIDPAAVPDSSGEWIELYNPGPDSVNLRDWRLGDADRDQHLIATDLWLNPGAYMVLGRNADPALNGNVSTQYVYAGLSLANEQDELQLWQPDGELRDEVVWGIAPGSLPAPTGASLERTGFSTTASWQVAQVIWPGSAGDRGTPNGAYVPAPTSTPVSPATATAPPVPTQTPTPGLSEPSTATPHPSDTPTPEIGGQPGDVLVSEFLADPAAVSDSDGEWLELVNVGSSAVNLEGWILADLDTDHHVVETALWLQPGDYVVLAREADRGRNGGVDVDYVYRGFVLANGEDEILLLTPSGTEADRIVYGGASTLQVTSGASLERIFVHGDAVWDTAASSWPGSSGDFGSPGSAYSPPPTATSTTFPTPLPDAWQAVDGAPLQIEEVHFLGTDEEFVVLQNRSDRTVGLGGWLVGDGHAPGSNEGIYALPDGYQLAAGALFVIARNGTAFQQRWGMLPHAQFQDSEANVPTLSRRGDLGRGQFALNDTGDEVVLLDPARLMADGVAYGNGNWEELGLAGTLYPVGSFSLQRIPDDGVETQDAILRTISSGWDPRDRYLWAQPDPFAAQVLMHSPPPLVPRLPGDMVGVWGSMGIASTYSPGGLAPPRFLRDRALWAGLHFLAIADTWPLSSVPSRPADLYAQTLPAPIDLPAWRWHGRDGSTAVVYGVQFGSSGEPALLANELAAVGAVAQWQGRLPLNGEPFVAVSGDLLDDPGDLYSLLQSWAPAEHLPGLVGNSYPPLPGVEPPAGRYTGLAVRQVDERGVLDAVVARRSWLTSQPGLALTLRAVPSPDSSGAAAWMGSTIAASDVVDLEVTYRDPAGEAAGLAIWQNGRPVAQLDIPPADGTWSVQVPALPGVLLFASATQVDGDFAVTAPLHVLGEPGGRIWINEVLPIPISDFNEDGQAGTEDEYIELYNPGTMPAALSGWSLGDRTVESETAGSEVRRTFTFGPDDFIAARSFRLVWGSESRIGLNNQNERIELINPSGQLVDFLEYGRGPGADQSFARVPDGGAWQVMAPSPGEGNGVSLPSHPEVSQPSPTPAWGSGAAPGTPGGEAVGEPNSVAQAKLAGLRELVRFQGVVIVPPGLFNSAIYVADPAPAPNETAAWLGIQVYLEQGAFPSLEEGDRVLVEGRIDSFRGEREVLVTRPEDVWRIESGDPLLPLPVSLAEIGESLEGRLVVAEGTVAGYQGASILLTEPGEEDATPIPVTVRGSLSWRRPFVNQGERWRAVGVVSQFADAPPWNGGYRILVRFESDLLRLQR